ncbi:MAG: hypothetical protein WBM50_22055 [Acidimicrobiales bacterium]
MRRRNGLGFWAVVIALFATFVAEPTASLDVAGQVFEAVGEFGGSVVSDLAADDNGGSQP